MTPRDRRALSGGHPVLPLDVTMTERCHDNHRSLSLAFWLSFIDAWR